MYLAFFQYIKKFGESKIFAKRRDDEISGEEMGPMILPILLALNTKGRLSFHLCIECFSKLSFDSEVYTKSAAVADFLYTSESNESCEKHPTQR